MARQYVGIDLHRRRSVIVHKSDDGEVLSTRRIDNDPINLAAAVANAGWVHNVRANPEVNLRRGKRAERLHADEVDADSAGPVLQRYVRQVRVVAPFFDERGRAEVRRYEQLVRGKAVVSEQAVHACGRCVARHAGVDDNHGSARPGEEQRAVQARCPSPDDDDVVGVHQLVAHDRTANGGYWSVRSPT